MLKIKIQKIHPNAVIPEYNYKDDSGMDLFSLKEIKIKPRHRVVVPTGLKIEIPKGYEMQIRPKSGLAIRNGITVLNTPGTIDAGYRGEIKVILINHSSKAYKIEKGQKICQAVFNKIERAKIIVSEELSKSERDDKGFGSTGLKKIRTNF
ncbi:MAG: dUTP diphosphatase [Candidatus Pacearchaeota archaeon]